MSEIHFIVVKGKNIYFMRRHYRKIKEMLECPEKINLKKGKYLDAGYILLDLNRKTIVNRQDAFALPKSTCELLKIL